MYMGEQIMVMIVDASKSTSGAKVLLDFGGDRALETLSSSIRKILNRTPLDLAKEELKKW